MVCCLRYFGHRQLCFANISRFWLYIILGDLGADRGDKGSLNGRKNMAQKKSKERPEELLGTMSYQTSSKRSPPFWLLIGARKTQAFLTTILRCVQTRFTSLPYWISLSTDVFLFSHNLTSREQECSVITPRFFFFIRADDDL